MILSIEEVCYVDVFEEQKILGHIIRSDMRTIYNTEYICKKALEIGIYDHLYCLMPNALHISHNFRGPGHCSFKGWWLYAFKINVK